MFLKSELYCWKVLDLDLFPAGELSSEFTLLLLPVSDPALRIYGLLPVADKGLFTAPNTPVGLG